MREDKLKKELIYKECIGRYDVIFKYKNHIKLLFMLPEYERDYAYDLLADRTIRIMMKLYHFFYIIFGKSAFDYFSRQTNFNFLLEEGDKVHDGEVSLRVVED